MKIGDAIAPLGLDRLAQPLGRPARGLRVEQHAARLAQQAHGPARDQSGADHPHHRVEPGRGEELGRQQGEDGQERRQGVGQDVQISGAQIVIVTMAMMDVVVVMAVAAMPRAARIQALAPLTRRPAVATTSA